MNIEELKNKILIIKDKSKKSILKKINEKNKLINVKIITLNELKKKYYFDYTKETIYYVSKKYNVVPDIAKIYIENLYYVNEKSEYEKVNKLIEIKKDLEEKQLIKTNKLFKEFLKNKDIILYNLKYTDKLYQNIFEELKKVNNIISYDEESEFSLKKLYCARNMEEEVTFVASYICKLINEGININNIKLANVKEGYIYTIRKIFKMFNIPVELPSNTTIEGTKLVKIFKENYNSNIEETLNILKENTKDEKDEEIYKQIINIVNEYSFIDDYNDVKEYILNDISKIKTKKNKLKNMVRIIDIENDLLTDDYVILMNFNEGVIPTNHKNEDYLNDEIKELLNQSTSSDLNYKDTENIKDKIKYTKNLILTYRNHDEKGEIFVSSAYQEDLITKEKINIEYNYSNEYNKLKLVSLKDEFNKFGTITNDLLLLNTKYKEDYLSYNNKFKNIKSDKLREFINEKLTLSYTSVNEYYQCSFRYYLSYILKVNKFEDTFEITIGNIFHKILSECFKEDYNFEDNFNKCVNESKYEFTISDKFFLTKVKQDLVLLIDTIKNHMNYTQLTKSMYEKEIIININERLGIRFKGIIDKVLYEEFNGYTIACIIDYKTGNPNLNIKNVEYGLDMQLPVYIYLLKNLKELSNVKVGGFYLQKVLHSETDLDEKVKAMRLQGYSNSDLDILEKVDSSYNDSKMIRSMKTTSNGFSHYAKIITDEEIDELSSKVENKIIEASDKVINALFDINPKELNGKNVGCTYCKYKDICYMTHKDIIKLD